MSPRVEPCDCCEGSGVVRRGHPNCPCDPSIWGCRCYDEECGACGGTGEIEVEAELITEDDLMEMCE